MISWKIFSQARPRGLKYDSVMLIFFMCVCCQCGVVCIGVVLFVYNRKHSKKQVCGLLSNRQLRYASCSFAVINNILYDICVSEDEERILVLTRLIVVLQEKKLKSIKYREC